VKKALAIVDGEHYASTVRSALDELAYEFVAVHMVGGTEKLRGGEEYGLPMAESLEDGIVEHEPDLVVDLSDEPVLGPPERLRLASRVLAAGLPYVGADFRFEPPRLEPFDLPSLGVVGTGKRVGKTAVAGHLARLLASRWEVVVVAMGRGGPEEPEVAETPPSLDDLLALSRAGRHAASDYLEDAALARVPTIGCRRAGGGLAGVPWTSNVAAGVQKALGREPEFVIFDGSGAAIPPVATRNRVLVAGAHQPTELVVGYLNAYRILISDLVVLTMAEDGTRHEELAGAIREVKDVPVVATVLRPRPIEPVDGKRVAFFTTADPSATELLEGHLREEHGAADATISCNLSRREELREDVQRAEADVFVVEIKAAAIDVVARAAAERDIPVVFADNDVIPLEGQPDLDDELRALAETAQPEPVP
jgi:cyclic 2,3-diphosphoglycerate synthetase